MLIELVHLEKLILQLEKVRVDFEELLSRIEGGVHSIWVKYDEER